jgi:hypothetical protein
MRGQRANMWKTNEADLASRQVMRAVARHEARSSTVPELGLSTGGESELALEAVSEIVTVVELFTTDTMIEISEQFSRDALPPVQKVAITSGRQDAEGSWATRREFAKNWLGALWGDTAWFREWLGYVEARNAWAHGHGALTRKQQNRRDVVDSLKCAQLPVVGARVELAASDVRRCGQSALVLAKELDEALFSCRIGSSA